MEQTKDVSSVAVLKVLGSGVIASIGVLNDDEEIKDHFQWQVFHCHGTMGMMYYTYHARVSDNIPKPSFPDDYDLVARVRAANIDQVFQFTNHIDRPWYESRLVLAVSKKVRSTSVGDVIIDPNGIKWVCMPIGWEEVQDDDI